MMFVLLAVGMLSGGGLYAQGLAIDTDVISSGSGWRLIDTDPNSRSGNNTMLWEVSPAGVANLPVSQAQKDLLTAAFADLPPSASESNLIFISQELLEALEQPTFPTGYEQYADEPLSEKSLGCSWKTETRNRSWPYSKNLLDKSYPFSGGIFSGSLDIDLPISGNVQIATTYQIRKCFGVPTGFRFVNATASGNASISGSGALSVTANASQVWEKEWFVDAPELGEVSFSVGPIPVRLVFTLPIYVGAKFEAALSAQLSASLDASASGSFTYTCTPDDCSGTSSFSDQFEFVGPTASASVDLKATAHARVMLRVALYNDGFAYVEGGLKAYARAGIWGYIGNACGDADGDGNNETVRALVADLNWGYQLAYGWGGWALPDRVHFTSPNEYYLGWRDLLGTGGSTALQPMILGPSSVAEGATATYTVKMRPCYKYPNAVNLAMAPGTWTGSTVVTPPGGTTTFSRVFNSSGNQTLVATAVSDSYGRNLNVPYSRVISVTSTTPAAPTGLTATALSATSVRLAWVDNSSNETQFELHRRVLPSGAFATAAIVGANSTVVVDTVQGSTSYEYRVRALNGTDGSGFSNLATVTTPSAGPAAPSGLTGSYNASTHRFTLNWADNSTTEQGFTLQFSFNGSAFSDMATLGANVTSYTSAVNPPLGSYQFRIRSYTGALVSAWSNTFSLLVNNPTPTTSIAWIQKAETSWGPAGTLTAAGYAANGSGTVQLFWRERNSLNVWGAWNAVAFQATPAADTTWSNTISSGNPTNACHWFDAYTIYSGVTSAVFHFMGAPGCP
ncbi:MAG TPA: fibronectin type III domain-containing protein [Thermoanaerobaculia bacterium]|jgi:hypothetical protein|nr:fibronectin type III domain-containing protein [Thermoanaerobaculia bacterium]